MGESGCLKDGNFQNLQVNGNITPGTGELSFGGLETRFASASRTPLTTTLVTQPLAASTHNTILAPAPSSGVICALTLPAQASSKKGDFITFDLLADMTNLDVLKIGTAGEFFSTGSKLHVVGEDATRIGVMKFSEATEDFLNITCATNGDGGTGTNFQCYFNGTTWGINCEVYGIGARSAASAATDFGTT
jgi:hypothetical protein